MRCRSSRILLIIVIRLIFVSLSLQTTRKCPIGNISENPKAFCYEDTTCAIFDNNVPLCIGWARNVCAMREYRDLNNCYCMKCPANTGENCYPGNECCSLEDCGTPLLQTTTPKPLALSATPRITVYILLTVLSSLANLYIVLLA